MDTFLPVVFGLEESISRVTRVTATDDAFKPLFKVLEQITWHTKNLNNNLEGQLEDVLQCMKAIRDSGEDVTSYKYKETLIKALSFVYLCSLSNKTKSRKSEKVLHIVSEIWHKDLMDTLQCQVSDLLSSPHLTSEQLLKVSQGLEDSSLFREAIDKSLSSVLTHINRILSNVFEHFKPQSQDVDRVCHSNPLMINDPAEQLTASIKPQDTTDDHTEQSKASIKPQDTTDDHTEQSKASIKPQDTTDDHSEQSKASIKSQDTTDDDTEKSKASTKPQDTTDDFIEQSNSSTKSQVTTDDPTEPGTVSIKPHDIKNDPREQTTVSIKTQVTTDDPTEQTTASIKSQENKGVQTLGSTPSGSPVLHMNLCYTCLKVCLQVFQYMPTSTGVLLWEDEVNHQLSQNLIINLQAVLSQRYSKDCNLIAGSALAMLVNTIPNITQAMLFIRLLSQDIQQPVRIGNADITSLTPGMRDGPYSKIAIIRGILTCCKPRLLLYREKNEDPIFLHVLFSEVVSICQSPNHSVLYNAFQLLVYWYESAIANLQQHITATPVHERKTCFRRDSQFVKNTLQLIWENWQSPLSGVPVFVKMIFDLLLEVHQKENKLFGIKVSELYNSLGNHLLQISWHVKGKYSLLSSLVPYVGALHLLSSYPTLPRLLIRGLATNFLASAVSDLHKALLQNMVKEIDLEGDAAAIKWKDIWGDCVVDVLCNEDDLVRFHGAQYWLPWILKCFPGSYNLLVNLLDTNFSHHAVSSKRHLHAVVMVMAQARQADIINFMVVRKSMSLISMALYHVDDDVRLHALALICNSPRKAESMQQVELDMLKRFLPLNLNCDGASFRQKMCAYIKTVLTRIRDSCLSSMKVLNRKKPKMKQEFDEKTVKAENVLLSGTEFLHWFLQELMQSLFPGACYQRKRAALGLLAIIYEVMLLKGLCNKRKGKTPECILDGSNDIRDLAYKIISTYFPWPLLCSKPTTCRGDTYGILSHGLQLISSPKSPECEAGSKIYMLVFQRHILEGQSVSSTQLTGTFKSMTIELCTQGPKAALPFLKQLTKILTCQHKCCSQNILNGSLTTPMHGILLTIRNCLTINSPYLSEIMMLDRDSWLDWINNLISIASDIINLAMSTLSGGVRGTELSPSFADMGEGIDDLVEKMRGCQMGGHEELKTMTMIEREEENPVISASHQLIMACCWLNLKEVSLLFGELSQLVPFAAGSGDGLLPVHQIHKIKEMFVNILTKCRHRGAIEGCNLGFSRFCASLLSSPSQQLSSTPAKLLKDVIHLIRNEGSTSSFTKKSAGLPLLMEAIVNSEPRGREKHLLQFTMTSLLKIAQQPEPTEHDPKLDLPQCHALNMLKALFRSAAINDDVIPYTSKSVILAINGFASKHFSIRNGSMLLFGSVVARMFGQKRVQDEHSRVNSMTACEFFVHYPELQRFLLQEICKCIDQQVAGDKSLHPSLFPVLIILSKLGCGLQSGEISVLEKFIQPVMLLSANPVYQVRVLAAEALVPLVGEDKILEQAMCIINSISKTRQELRSQNQLHGQLLQIQKLITAHMDNALGSPQSSDVQNVCSCLCSIHWIGSKENNCQLTKALFIETITKLVTWLLTNASKVGAYSIGEEICRVAKCYLNTGHIHQIAEGVLTETMVNSLLSLNHTQVLENLTIMLKSGSPDIMVSAERHLLEQKDHSIIKLLVPLVPNLLDLLKTNSHQTALLENTLKLLVEISIECGHKVDVDWMNWWDCLLELANGAHGVSVSCAALPALAVIVKTVLEEGPTLRCDIEAFCRLLVINSEATMSETSRLAVANALKIVGTDILKEFQSLMNEGSVVHAISVFTAALNLLQDEQSEVRCQATRFVSQLSEEIADEELQVVQASDALQMFIKYMCEHFSWSNVFLSDLCRRLFGSTSDIEIKSQNTIGTVNLFQQDDANIYWEPANLATFLHRELLVLVTKLARKDQETLRNWIKSHLPDTRDQVQLLCNQLNEKVTACGSFFGVSGLPKPYCVILCKLLQVHLLMSANCLLSPDAAIDLSDLHLGASNLTKIQDLHPFLQDLLSDITKLTQTQQD